jgi:hypothetical protein
MFQKTAEPMLVVILQGLKPFDFLAPFWHD